MKKLFFLIFPALFLLAACFHESAPEAPADEPEPAEISTESPESSAPAPTPAPVPTPTPAPPPSPPPATEKIESQILFLKAGNIFFEPKSFTVKVNRPVTVNFTSRGSHTFTVDELGVNEKLNKESGSFTFTPTKTGGFTFYCSVPGHRQAGQFGTIAVTE